MSIVTITDPENITKIKNLIRRTRKGSPVFQEILDAVDELEAGNALEITKSCIHKKGKKGIYCKLENGIRTHLRSMNIVNKYRVGHAAGELQESEIATSTLYVYHLTVSEITPARGRKRNANQEIKSSPNSKH